MNRKLLLTSMIVVFNMIQLLKMARIARFAVEDARVSNPDVIALVKRTNFKGRKNCVLQILCHSNKDRRLAWAACCSAAI